MRCDSIRARIDDHVDGLLPLTEAEAVRDHLESCAPCRTEALAARAASTSLAAWGDVEPPAHCFDVILRRIDSLPPEALERPRRRRRLAPVVRLVDHRWIGTGGLAAAAAVLAGFTVAAWEDSVVRPAPVRRNRVPVSATFARLPAAPRPVFFDSYVEDDGLHYRRERPVLRGVPANIPAAAHELLGASPR